MSTTAEQMRAWRGPAVLTYGFRPFFFGAAVWAALAMVLWVLMLAGHVDLPTRFDPVSWHAHEFLFGYLGAVVAGFMLTAVPNWTGRLPIVGWPLGGLVALWLAGRLAVAFSLGLSPLMVALADLSATVALGIVLAREIIAGKNWRNLIVVAMLAVFTLGNAIFHWEAAHDVYAAQGYGLRLGLGAGIMMIGVIGGRIVPSFTRNWLAKRDEGALPTPPMQRFDKLALLVLLVALITWVVAPQSAGAALALGVAGVLHLVRLARWRGLRTLSEPLVWVLHLGYFFVPLGALMVACNTLLPGHFAGGAAQHLWMAGAIGLMTLAVMTRATLGHSGQTLSAGPGTVVIYVALIAAVVLRLAAGLWAGEAQVLLDLAGLAWIGAYGCFAVLYGRFLLSPSPRR
ncbi:NnrS family protein [Aquicoccus sp. G2-2]|uniref:NnrS family protein n=1 Tax=Aquicoccus sp. G2-2 TaxID=3092120 RepID=UPI002AE0A3CA|nr:NnrS family protein [Aquicoccus sp. G2-2]MEA1113497.1 NnrS family protein [Aquicoccus sp. G2-2]